MSSSPRFFTLPDLLAVCPFKGSTNPNYAKASAESSEWVLSFKVFDDSKRDFFLQGGSELLCSHAYPYAGFEQLRTCCDFVNLLFTVDEISDEQNGNDALHTGEVMLNSLRDADWNDGSTLARMTKEFRTRFLRYAGPSCYRRFVQHCEDYITAFAKEASYREQDIVLDMASFETLRRENSAVRFCFGLFGYVLRMDLPDEVHDNPAFATMHFAAVDMVCWSNDLYSYNMEQAMGHTGNNILTVLMKAKNLDLQGAADYVGEYFKVLMNRFVEAKANLPSWGPEVDPAVAQYTMAMESWVIGNLEWSFETQRYFGSAHAKIKETLVVELYPRKTKKTDEGN